MNYRTTPLMILALIGTPTQAQWAKETNSFRTVEIGIPVASLPECPKRKHAFLAHEEYISDHDNAYPPEMKDKLCWKLTNERPIVSGATALTLSNLPFIKGAGREVFATIINGNIESIDSRFLSQYAESFRTALIEKYGKPTKQEINNYQNKFGSKFSGISLSWYGKHVTLTFNEVDGSSEWGLMSMRSRKFDAALTANQSEAIDSVKRGL